MASLVEKAPNATAAKSATTCRATAWASLDWALALWPYIHHDTVAPNKHFTICGSVPLVASSTNHPVTPADFSTPELPTLGLQSLSQGIGIGLHLLGVFLASCISNWDLFNMSKKKKNWPLVWTTFKNRNIWKLVEPTQQAAVQLALNSGVMTSSSWAARPPIWWLWGPPWRAGNTAMSMRSWDQLPTALQDAGSESFGIETPFKTEMKNGTEVGLMDFLCSMFCVFSVASKVQPHKASLDVWKFLGVLEENHAGSGTYARESYQELVTRHVMPCWIIFQEIKTGRCLWCWNSWCWQKLVLLMDLFWSAISTNKAKSLQPMANDHMLQVLCLRCSKLRPKKHGSFAQEGSIEHSKQIRLENWYKSKHG